MIFLGNVPANSDGIQPMQPRFLAASAPSIAQYSVVADDEDIRDELLVTLVLFGLASIQVNNMRSGRHHGQVFLNFKTQALKHPQLFEEFSFKTKHSFF